MIYLKLETNSHSAVQMFQSSDLCLVVSVGRKLVSVSHTDSLNAVVNEQQKHFEWSLCD